MSVWYVCVCVCVYQGLGLQQPDDSASGLRSRWTSSVSTASLKATADATRRTRKANSSWNYALTKTHRFIVLIFFIVKYIMWSVSKSKKGKEHIIKVLNQESTSRKIQDNNVSVVWSTWQLSLIKHLDRK